MEPQSQNLYKTKAMIRPLVLVAALMSCIFYSEAFSPHSNVQLGRVSLLLATESEGDPLTEEEKREIVLAEQRKKTRFRKLVEESVAVTNPEHMPKILANNIQVITALQGQEGASIITEIVEDAKAESEEQFNRTVMVIEMILNFAETFVEEANEMDEKNKKLLGKIVNAMKSRNEDTLDELMKAEKENFSSGFLRHIEGECNRIANAPRMTGESTRLLEMLSVIQTRVLEEIGRSMGEATLVLGQLMGYDDRDELIGVLDAGLTVQGQEFALEMKGLTEEALSGFRSVHGGVDPELVEKVSFVDERLQNYLEENNAFQ